jgi:hypothetical protein
MQVWVRELKRLRRRKGKVLRQARVGMVVVAVPVRVAVVTNKRRVVRRQTCPVSPDKAELPGLDQDGREKALPQSPEWLVLAEPPAMLLRPFRHS